jgi:hypothetical protein
MFEFDPTYVLDTGALTDFYTGSGVHLYKDVSLLFDILDPGGSVFLTDSELANSASIKDVSFDILTTGGDLIYKNYRNGKTRFVQLSSQENFNLFGFYQKDFGIRATIENNINEEKFIAEFYLYGNLPVTNSVITYDGTSGSFASGYGIYDKIRFHLLFQNDTRYTKFNRTDVYVHTSPLNDIGIQSDNALDTSVIYNNPYYLYTQPALSYFNNNSYQPIIDVPINKIYYDTPYYFAIIPYSEVGSGEAIYVGPLTATRENQDDPGEDVLATNQIQLVNGESSMNIDFITGIITGAINTNTVLDSIPKDLYNTIKYTAQIIDSNLAVSSSELKFVITSTGSASSGVSFSEYDISDNNYPVYSYTDSDDEVFLNVSGVSPTGIYKLYRVAL